MHALGAFQEHLPPGTSKTSIRLKYPCRTLEGTAYWSGLQAAKGSREMWMGLMTPADAERLPEVGVHIKDEPADEPLIGKNGLPAKARIYDYARGRWILEDGPNVLGRPLLMCLPPTYQVRPYF